MIHLLDNSLPSNTAHVHESSTTVGASSTVAPSRPPPWPRDRGCGPITVETSASRESPLQRWPVPFLCAEKDHRYNCQHRIPPTSSAATRGQPAQPLLRQGARARRTNSSITTPASPASEGEGIFSPGRISLCFLIRCRIATTRPRRSSERLCDVVMDCHCTVVFQKFKSKRKGLLHTDT